MSYKYYYTYVGTHVFEQIKSQSPFNVRSSAPFQLKEQMQSE